MWTGGQLMKIRKSNLTSVISSCESVNCAKEAFFLLHVFFLTPTIPSFDKKCGQVDKQ